MSVYVVDDDPAMGLWLGQVCAGLGLTCRVFERTEDFLGVIDVLAPGCLLLDVRAPDHAGLRLMEELGRRGSGLAVIAIGCGGDIEVAVRAMKLGAVDFLEKPFLEESLVEALRAAGFNGNSVPRVRR